MAWNGGIDELQSLAPYMMGRQPAGILDRDASEVRNVSSSGVLTLQWGRSQDGENLPSAYMVYASGVYGQKVGFAADHHPMLWICHDTPFTEREAETIGEARLLASGLPAGNARGLDAFGVPYDGLDVGLYIRILDSDSYCYLHRLPSGQHEWIPVRVAEANGTATIDGILCDVFQCAISIRDLHDISGYDDIISDFRSGGFFGLCWANNGRHESGDTAVQAWDAVFYVPLPESTLHETHFQRTELNSRVAGERAIFEDEFLTASQLEAGSGITLRWRNSSGAADGYTTLADKAYNLIFEVTEPATLAIGTNDVDVIDPQTGLATAYDGLVSLAAQRLVFSDEQDWDYGSAGNRVGILATGTEWGEDSLPVNFRAVELPTGQINVSARTKHNGVYTSHDNLDQVTNMDAGPNGTTAHFRFRDSTTLHWTLTEEVLDGPTGFRKGVSIVAEVQGSGGYSWFAFDQDHDSQEILGGNEIKFFGINGVSTTLGQASPGVFFLSIDRPLTIQNNGLDVGGKATTELNFDSNGATAEANTSEVYFAVDSISGANRRVRAYSKSAGVSTPPHIKTQWWYDLGIRTNGLQFGFDAGLLNFQNYYNVCPAGHYDNNGVLATNFEIVMRDGTAIDVGTLTAPLYSRRPSQWVGKTIRVSASGVYDINTTIRGIHDVANMCATFGINNHRMDIHLFLVVGRGGVIRNYQYLDLYQWAQFQSSQEVNGRRAAQQEHVGHLSSIPWGVQGSSTVALQQNDEVWFVLRFNGLGQLLRHVYVGYQAFDMHMLTDRIPLVNVMPHALSNVNADGSFTNFDYLNW